MAEWQPIETAPKDSRVLLLIPGRLRSRIVIGEWDRQRFHRRPRPYWAYSPWPTSDRECPPTLWQPLPSIPEPPEVPRG